MSRSSLLWILLVLLLAPAALGGAVVLRAHRLLADPEMLAGSFSLGLGGNVEFDAIDVEFWPPAIVIRGLTLADRSVYGPGQLGHIDSVSLRAAVRPLLFGEVVFDNVLLEKPTVRIVQGADGWNLDPLVDAFSLPPAFSVLTVEAVGARLSYRDRTRPGGAEMAVRDATLQATRGSDTAPWSGTLQGVSPGRDIDGGLSISFRVPPDAPGDYRVRAVLDGLDGAAFDELVQLAGGAMPFGVRTIGRVSGALQGLVPREAALGPGRIEANLDYTQAEIRTAGAWTLKRREVPLSIGLGLEVGAGRSLRLLRFDAESGAASLRGLPGAAQPGSLRIVSEDCNGRLLERFVPALAALRPRGAVALDGVLTIGVAEGPSLSLSVTAEPLSLLPDENRWELGGLSLGLDLEASGAVVSEFSAFDLAGPTFGFARLSGSYSSREGAAPSFAAMAEGGGRSGAEVEKVAMRGSLRERALVVDELRASGLGGTLAGAASVERSAGGGWGVESNLVWQGLRLEELAPALGWSQSLRGNFSGRAVVRTAGADSESLLAATEGPLEVELRHARLGGEPPLAAALGALSRLPGGEALGAGTGLEQVDSRLGDEAVVEELTAVGVLAASGFRMARLEARNHAWNFEGDGRVGFDGVLDVRGDLDLSPFTRDVLREELPLASALFGDGEAPVPLVVEGELSDLRLRPASRFVQAAGLRALRETKGAPGALIRDFLDGNVSLP